MWASMSAWLRASMGASGRLRGSENQGGVEQNYQRVKELSANCNGSTERVTWRCYLASVWLILIISYISVHVRLQISVGVVVGYYVSDGSYVYQCGASILWVSVEVRYRLQYYKTINVGYTELCIYRFFFRTSTNHRVIGQWLELIYLMGICDSGLVWIMLHISPGPAVISTMVWDTFDGLLGVAYKGQAGVMDRIGIYIWRPLDTVNILVGRPGFSKSTSRAAWSLLVYIYSAFAEYCQYTSRKDPTSNGYCSAPCDTQREHLWKRYRVNGSECCNSAEGCDKDVIGWQ